jgi:alpha-L-fucosidase
MLAVKTKLTNILLVTLIVMSCLDSIRASAQQSSATSLQQWKDQKYSMFIHFGIYSVLGGVWDGKPITRGLSEQIQAHAGIYSDTYADVAGQFNPTQWNADSVVLLAKASGMRSVIITAKHHDGFCMFESQHTDFDVVDATPYKQDILLGLAQACRRHEVRFGIYFSLIDWHFPQASPISSHNSDDITPEHHEYNKKQVTELLTRYGAISELWFDMGSQSAAQSKQLRDLVHQLQPNCLVSSRVGNDQGDFTVLGDNQEPDYSIGVPWQSPASMFDVTWGYRSWQVRGDVEEKANEKLASLIRVVSQGGNYLLNIGPKGDGSIVPFEKDVLKNIGHWLKQNGESIYETMTNPFDRRFDWGTSTRTSDKLFLHILSRPANGSIRLPMPQGTIKSIHLLSGDKQLTWAKENNNIVITLPELANTKDHYQVAVIEFAGSFIVSPSKPVDISKQSVKLDRKNAFHFFSNSGIDYNTRFRSVIKENWTLQINKPTQVAPTLYYTEEELGKEICLQIGENTSTSIRLDSSQHALQRTSGVTFGSPYVNGPFWSGIEDANGAIDLIRVNEIWPSNTERSWKNLTNYKEGELLSFEAGAMTAYYFLQEIKSSKPQMLSVQIASGDAVVVFVNGKQEFIHQNPKDINVSYHTLNISLEAGVNQILVKAFNHFHKAAKLSIGYKLTQKVFYKRLPKTVITGQVPVSLFLCNPPTIHQDLGTPNLWIEIKK